MSPEFERTPDGRYIIVKGRRWRASDPGIPDDLRAELVGELMAARRLVRSDPARARPRVQDAKVALGERGEAWWETTQPGRRDRCEAVIRVLLRRRDGAGVPLDDVARVVGGEDGQDRLTLAHEAAARLVDAGAIALDDRRAPGGGAQGRLTVGLCVTPGPAFPW